MSITSRIGSKGMFATSVFYAIVGIVFIILLPMSGFAPHIGLMGIISLVTAYGLFTKRTWSFWLVFILFISITTFAALMIYDLMATELLITSVMIILLVLTWIFTGYAMLKRKTFGD
jgi:uncharacterized membrane protein HdeD (DUF308 family)